MICIHCKHCFIQKRITVVQVEIQFIKIKIRALISVQTNTVNRIKPKALEKCFQPAFKRGQPSGR